MNLDWFVKNYSHDSNIGRQIGLYIIAPDNLSAVFQKKNYFRAGVAGSRITINQDRSVTASGADSKSSSLHSRAAMYFANWINSGTVIAALILPPAVVNKPTGPVITRILEKTNPLDGREAYQLKGQTMAVALEKIFHLELDSIPKVKVKRARTERVEWFQTTEPNYINAKLALQSVGHGIYYDFTKFPRNVLPEDLVGKGVKLSGGQTFQTTTHEFRKSPRLLQMTQDDVTEEDGSVKLSLDDIEDIRNNTIRGQQIIEMISRKGPQKSATTQTDAATQAIPQPRRTRSRANQTQNPVFVRLTRSKINQLREAAKTDNEEVKRKKIARVLAQLS